MGDVVLVTGYPGFIGQRLLPRVAELLPGSRFRCLVQEKFLETARRDLAELARRDASLGDRVRLVAGDITLAGLGVEEAEAGPLQAELTRCLHLAAVYDLAVERELAERVNVGGTRNVLEFVRAAPGFARLDYVSTAYVSGTAAGVFRETDLEVGQDFKNHYERTKYLAEVEVVRSGVPATIYRPGVVVGDSRTGETAKFDGPYFALRAMERVPSPGLFVTIGSGTSVVNVVPVDFVVEALARLATLDTALGRTYHLTDPAPLPVAEMERLFARVLGRRFVYLPIPMALARVVFGLGPVERYLGMPVESIEYFDHPCRYDASHATRDLAPFGVTCPRLPDYVERLVEFYRARRDAVRRTAMV